MPSRKPLLLLGPTRTDPFGGRTLQQFVDHLLEEIRELYGADSVPWVVGYSGGKDSTLVLMLVWMAVAGLPPDQRTKTVHVITTDTGVENPVVAAWVNNSLQAMTAAAEKQDLPIQPHRLTPALGDTFWVCLIGRGYAAPRPKFRWCTDRLKIRPSDAFIRTVVNAHGQAILVLGTRKSESATRARAMERHERRRVRDRLSPHGSLPNSLVYSPIEMLSNDDVWVLLMQYANPWEFSNKDLLTLYQGASPDAECPLVVDSTTPSCGSSRFGCWTCTMVTQDRSMQAMIRNDEEKSWMLPLLSLRNALDVEDDRHLRDFRRSNGSLMLHRGRLVHGPYTQAAREDWLRRLLEAQTWIRAHGPEYVRDVELVTLAELHEIRRLWVFEKYEFEDSLPGIYEKAAGSEFPSHPLGQTLGGDVDAVAVLWEVCDGDEQQFLLLRELLGIERRFRTSTRRAGLLKALEGTITKYAFADEEEALGFALDRAEPYADVVPLEPLDAESARGNEPPTG